MRLIKGLAVVALLTATAANVAWAQSPGPRQTALSVVSAWSRATAPSQKAGGVFLTIQNAGDQPDRLIGVESAMADSASLHTMVRDGDVMKMRPLEDGIEVPANGHVVLAPGGHHVMLIGLRDRLAQDTTVPVTLIFERAGRIDVNAAIQAAGARGPSGAGDHSRHGGAHQAK